MKKNVIIGGLVFALLLSVVLNIYLLRSNTEAQNNLIKLHEEFNNTKSSYEEQLNIINSKISESEKVISTLEETISDFEAERKRHEEEKRAQMEAQQKSEAERKVAEEQVQTSQPKPSEHGPSSGGILNIYDGGLTDGNGNGSLDLR